MMTNNTIKKRIIDTLAEKEIIINKVVLKGIEKTENQITIGQVIISLENIDGVEVDRVVSCLNEVQERYNIVINGRLLEV